MTPPATCILGDKMVHERTAMCHVGDGFEVVNAALAPERVLNAHDGLSPQNMLSLL